MLRIVWGWEVISFVVGSRMVERIGWSLARGWSPAAVFRFVVVSFRAFPVEGIFFFPDGVHKFPVSFVDDGCDRFMTEAGDVF